MPRTRTTLISRALVAAIAFVLAPPVRTVQAATPTASDPSTVAQEVPEASTVALIGDSLTSLISQPMQQSLVDAGWPEVVVSAGAGRSVDSRAPTDNETGLMAVSRLEREADPSDWIIALGTNDARSRPPSTFPDIIDRMLDRIGAGRRVLWVNVHLPEHPAAAAAWNAALDEAQRTHGGMLVVLDWATMNARHPEWLIGDRVHHTAAGNAAWIDVITRSSRELLAPAGPAANPPHSIVPNADAAGFVPLVPQRLLDTRTSAQVEAGGIVHLPLVGVVPLGTTAVEINLTAVESAHAGYLVAFACGSPVPSTSAVNVTSLDGRARSSATIAALSPQLELCVFTSMTTDVIVDVFGAFVRGTGWGFDASAPRRLADTRSTPVPVLGAGGVLVVDTGLRSGAAMVNLTVDRVGADGYLTVWSCDQPRPLVSNLNQSAVEGATANVALVSLGATGEVCIFTSAPTAMIVDLIGVFDADRSARFHASDPERIVDTRGEGVQWRGMPAPGQILRVVADGVPPGAFVVGTITAVDAVGSSYVSVHADSAPASTSSLNVSTGETRANLFAVGTDADGAFHVEQSSTGRAHVLVDVAGWFAT